MSEELTVEATGETVGEAKWKALRELERPRAGLDKAAVRFQVLSEGERGLLGVGYTPARVLARGCARWAGTRRGVRDRRGARRRDAARAARARVLDARHGGARRPLPIDVREDDDTVDCDVLTAAISGS